MRDRATWRPGSAEVRLSGAEPTRVLVAEDDPVSRRVVEALLRKWNYDVQTVADGTEAWRALQSLDAPRLALLDWMLPGFEGVEICRMLRRDTARPYVYIVLLTAVSQKQDLVTALDAGADDYLVKPFDAAELRARLHVGRRILAAQDELIMARETLRFQATHDPLTGLWNHGEVLRVLEQELARAARDLQPLAVFMVDLDHFKLINDRHGHVAGDTLLCEVSRRLTACVRPYDAVGRYGGEEFLIVVPAIDSKSAGALASRIHDSLSDCPLRGPSGPVTVTASIGVAISSPEDPREPMALVRAADIALYRAKERGRNRVEACLPEELHQPS
jgi:two-component system cell cycle response regulator